MDEPKYGTVEYCLKEAKKKIDEALEKVSKIRNDIGNVMVVEKVKHPIFNSMNSYFNGSSYLRFDSENRTHVDSSFKNAFKNVKDTLNDIEDIHEMNLPAIKINKETKQKVIDFMSSVGIPTEYTIYDYPTSRHKTKQSIKKRAGFLDDIDRTIPINDGYESAKKACLDAEKRFQTEYDRLIQNINKKEKEEALKQKAEEDKMELARFQVKYDATGKWEDILDVILSKDKYLRLGHYLLMNRNDWNDGPSYAEHGLDGFKISDNVIDQMIHDEIFNLIENWDGDGRAFRDCQSNYDYLFGISDAKLYEDYCKVREKIDL